MKQFPLKRLTVNTITSTRELMLALEKVRNLGYSLDAEESELGATCVAVPIFGYEGQVVGALSLSGPTPRVRDKQNRIATALKAVAATVSESLTGGSGRAA